MELHDNKFWTNLRKNGIDLEEILKIGMEDVFVLLLKSNQWKILFDHLITEGPIFLYFWVVAFLLIHQKQVFHCQEPYITSRVLTIDTRVDMSQIIQMAYFLTKNTPDKIITIHKDWKRLSTSEYPLLYLRPLKDMHDIQSQENEVSKSTSNRLQETNTKTEDRKMDKGPITSELKTEDGYNDINRMDPVVKLQIEQGKLH